jgi:hypothetical protein
MEKQEQRCKQAKRSLWITLSLMSFVVSGLRHGIEDKEFQSVATSNGKAPFTSARDLSAPLLVRSSTMSGLTF